MVYNVRGSFAAGLPILVAARYQGLGVSVTEDATVVDSLGNSSVVLETPSGDITSVAAALRYIANLNARSNFGGNTAFQRAQIDQWCDWAFNEVLPRRLASAVASKTAMLKSLINMGIRHSPIQRGLRSRARGINGSLEKLDAVLAANKYLAGDHVTAADVAVASCLGDVLSYLITPAEYEAIPNVMSWFIAIRNQPEFVTVAGLPHLVKKRIGDQIDLRPSPEDVAMLAAASVAQNAGYKKAKSQRDQEKEKAGKKKDKSGAEESKGEAAPAPAAAAAKAATASQPEGNLTLPEKTPEERITITVAKLAEHGITAVETVRHEACMTADATVDALKTYDAAPCKNLFLKAKKPKEEGDTRLWLVVALHDTNTNMKTTQKLLGYGKIVMRFSDAKTLVSNLGVVQGSVSPLALMNDTAQQVRVALDKRMMDQALLAVHPLTNEASVFLTPAQLVQFLKAEGHEPVIIDYSA